MHNYIINNIMGDGYERYVQLERSSDNIVLTAHFFEYGEYLEDKEKSSKKNIGESIDVSFFVDLVTKSNKIYDRLYHRQSIENSSHIEMVVEVEKIVDDYSVLAKSSISDELIKIDFEERVNYKLKDRIWLLGSLELIEEDY